MVTVRYLDSTARHFDESVLGWLLAELPSARVLKFASAYFDASVLDWLQEPLEALVARSGRVQALIGSNSGQTSRADLERLHAILDRAAGSSLHVAYAEGGIFHPKVFVIEQPTAVKAAIGSANLTSAGSVVNVEAGVIVATDRVGPPAEAPLQAIIDSIDAMRQSDAFEIASLDYLDRLQKLGIIDRVIRREATNLSPSQARRQRERRRAAGVGTRAAVDGIPPKTRRPTPAAPVSPPATAPVPPIAANGYYGLEFSANDLKDTGTREISVSSSVRDWAAGVLGRPINPGEGTLFHVLIEGRVAGSPSTVHRTPEPVRIWAAGGSGGTHQDVRLVLAARLKTALDDEATSLTGVGMPPGSIGVFELPTNPGVNPVRVTVFLPSDPSYAGVASQLGRSGREQKRHFRIGSLASMPPWP